MGGAVGVVIGQIIIGAIVSKASTKIAQKIGFSDDVAGLIGIGAGMYAGSQVGGAPTPGTGSTEASLTAATNTPPPVAPPKEPASWWSRLFTPEKTMDLAMAGLSGYGKAGIAKEQMEYDDKMKQKNATAWTNYRGSPGGGLPQLSPNFPSQPAG